MPDAVVSEPLRTPVGGFGGGPGQAAVFERVA
jgi:hypothetical protein